jgi:NitT/TauT family transport system substrate-binding protein
MSKIFTRREFLAGASALGAASMLGMPRIALASSSPEVKRIRLANAPAICLAPMFLAEEFLRAEGFEEVEYVKLDVNTGPEALAEGLVDVTMWDIPGTIAALDNGGALKVLSGVHAGCYELIASDDIRNIRDLRGKTIGVQALSGGDRMLISSMLAYIGLDPRSDVNWSEGGDLSGSMRLFLEGQVDAFMGFAPQPQELRRMNVGHVLVNTVQDRPWSQYYCCSVLARQEFASRFPIATKKVLRAFLKAGDMCSDQPERVARYLVDRGFEPRYDIGLEVLKGLPYKRWREANVEDTIRFHALRLHEVGIIKTAPNELVARSVDRRFLDEIRQELKA